VTTLPYPTVSGVIPLNVRFNLCPSDDPDMIHLPDGTLDPRGDSLNWQFNFGDYQAKPAFDPITGQFNPDFDHFCRVEHVYEKAGTFVATLSVTDKHVEDQGKGVSGLARSTVRVTVNAFPVAPPEPPPASAVPVILTFTATGGCPADLAWTTSNATSASISPLVGAVPPNGSTSADFGTNAVSCTLTAIGPGGTATKTITCPGDNNC